MTDSNSGDEVDAVLASRERDYGVTVFNQEVLAQVWTALLEQHYQQTLPHQLPTRMVPIMMAALKLARAAVPAEHRVDDNYLDAQGYLRIAEQCDTRPPVKDSTDDKA